MIHLLGRDTNIKKYILRLENKSYVTLIKEGKNARVHETDLHCAFPLRDIEEAKNYAAAINNKEKIYNEKIFSNLKVIEITELTITTKVTSRHKL